MVIKLAAAALVSAVMLAGGAPPVHAESVQDTVVILHGIGHTRWNMFWVERALKKEGYLTINITYPSRRQNVAALAGFVHKRLAAEKIWERQGKVHFVTHSMGGIVTRRYLDAHQADIPPEKMGRVVMIAPPNAGSEVADLLLDFPPYIWVFGPAGQELSTTARAADLTRPWYDAGIIAGSRGWPYFVATWLIDGAHDGRVAVEKTKLPGMKAHIVVPATHSFISWKAAVHSQAAYFLKNGEFQ